MGCFNLCHEVSLKPVQVSAIHMSETKIINLGSKLIIYPSSLSNSDQPPVCQPTWNQKGAEGHNAEMVLLFFNRPPDNEIKTTLIQTISVKRNKFCKTWRKIKEPQEGRTEAMGKGNPREQLFQPHLWAQSESWVWNRSEYSGAAVPWARGGNRGSQSWLHAVSWSCWAPAVTVSWRSTGIPFPFHLL